MLAQQAGIKGRTGKAKDLEIELMKGSFDTDPFRLVKVSDCLPVGDVNTKILYAVNKKKTISKFEARGPFQILEVIQPGAIFNGTISIVEMPPKAGITTPVTADKLFESLIKFYGGAFDFECLMLRRIGVDVGAYAKAKDDYKDIVNSKAFFIRVGRHSGAEAVTIEDNRSIKIMQGKGKQPKYEDASTTVWLASDDSRPKSNTALLPFGWLLLSTVELKTSVSCVEEKLPAQRLTPPAPPARPMDSFINQVKARKASEIGPICQIIDTALAKLQTDDEKKEFARAVKAHMGDIFKKSKAEARLKAFIE